MTKTDNKLDIPTHIGLAFLGEDEQYVKTIWLQREGSYWFQHQDRSPACWHHATGLAVSGSRASIPRVQDVRETTDQDKRRWLQDRLVRMEATVLHGTRERGELERKLADLIVVLTGTAQHCNDLRQALEELDHD